jgi:hypothetical protein
MALCACNSKTLSVELVIDEKTGVRAAMWLDIAKYTNAMK